MSPQPVDRLPRFGEGLRDRFRAHQWPAVPGLPRHELVPGGRRPGRVLALKFPLESFPDQVLYFVKPGHSSEECSNPNAVVALQEGQQTTPSQMAAMFGVAQPPFSTLSPFTALACYTSAQGANYPGYVNLEMTVELD